VIDDLRQLPPGSTISADICLIGAGAAGITIARELAGSALRVCLVEGGGEQYEYQDSQQLYAGNSVGVPVALEAGRLRFFGGTTNHWGGRCAPLDEQDFRQRDWIPHSGWPIDRAELDPYYLRARQVCGFSSPWLSDQETLSYLNVTLPAFNQEWLRPFLWHYTPVMKDAPAWHWATAYGPLLQQSSNIRTLLHANFAAFTTSGDRTRIRSLTVQSINGVSARIDAAKFVVCCGGIENARLLLLAAEANSGGFGNNHDLVGRFFMQHPRGPSGLIVSPGLMSQTQAQFNLLLGRDGLVYEVGLTMAPQLQQQERLLNCSGVFQYQGDPDSGVAIAQDIWRSLKDGKWPPDMGNKVGRVAADFGDVVRGLEHRIAAGHSMDLEGSNGIPSRSAILLLDLEQAPNPESRVTLAVERDALGLRRVQANWQLGEMERRTAARFASFVGAEFARLGIGRCRIEPWLQDDRLPMTSALHETYHYIGTTRMADDPSAGVTDRNCAVHGMQNLFVAGSSVFSTAGQANPTLTIVALALRLADHLKS
jgi:choline dehydrogenase-like flavoprotein